jgi:hypothetical protein
MQPSMIFPLALMPGTGFDCKHANQVGFWRLEVYRIGNPSRFTIYLKPHHLDLQESSMLGVLDNLTASLATRDTKSLQDYCKCSGSSTYLSQSYEPKRCKIK